jgi:DNA excision repair protein ERCC-2
MKITIDELVVYFPFEVVYKEQFEYMKNLKAILDDKSHGIIEMPTGTGKTVSMFALCTSYKLAYPDRLSKIVFCTRTLSQLQKATEELRAVEKNLRANGMKPLLSHVISARRNLCINPEVNIIPDRDKLDTCCKKRVKYKTPSSCSFYDNYLTQPIQLNAASSTLNIEDLLEMGKDQHICPYFSAKSLIASSDFILCNYPYIIDYKVNEELLKNLTKESIVIIDEAHNIDDVCVDSMTLKIDKFLLDKAHENLQTLVGQYDKRKQENLDIFEKEYKKLISSTRNQMEVEGKSKSQNGANGQNHKMMQNLESMDKEKMKSLDVMPGSLRKATHFFSFTRRILAYLSNFMKQREVLIFESDSFIHHLKVSTHIDESGLLFASKRLQSLLETIQFLDIDEIIPLSVVFSFAETLASFSKGFRIIFEPFYDTGKKVSPVLQLVCLDSSIAMKSILNVAGSVVLTSGTMTPMDLYTRILDLGKTRAISIEPQKSRNNISPLIVTKANDQSFLTTEFSERGNGIVSKNYGELLVELARIVPDGIVVFFPSYSYMEEIVTEWNKLALIEDLLKYKLLFIETKDQAQTSLALQNYKNAIERGRGGIFLCVARGKVAEGVDFKNHLGRCALVIGIPFQYTKSRALMCRTEFLEKNFGILQKQFIVFDAMRQTAQCLGRVVRGKMDYGIMILADRRYSEEKTDTLPQWIQGFIKSENSDLQINLTSVIVKKYFVEMSTNLTPDRNSYYLSEDFIQ